MKSYGEPGAVVYLADCVELMRIMPAGCVDAVFADPPYRLSGGGVTVKNGKLASVDKGSWDVSRGFEKDHEFNVTWLREARRILKPDGTLWVTGTHHVIFSLGFALQTLGFRIINDLVWEKPDPPPNARHTTFTHAQASCDNPAPTSPPGCRPCAPSRGGRASRRAPGAAPPVRSPRRGASRLAPHP